MAYVTQGRQKVVHTWNQRSGPEPPRYCTLAHTVTRWIPLAPTPSTACTVHPVAVDGQTAAAIATVSPTEPMAWPSQSGCNGAPGAPQCMNHRPPEAKPGASRRSVLFLLVSCFLFCLVLDLPLFSSRLRLVHLGQPPSAMPWRRLDRPSSPQRERETLSKAAPALPSKPRLVHPR